MGADVKTLGTISAISLFVEDVPQAKEFYQDVFEVPVVYEDEVSAALKFDNLIVNPAGHSWEIAQGLEPS